ncbi:MAG: TolC family protein [Fuerstiella sp.]
MFAIVAAGMFYGAHTTGELNSAQGQLQSPPIVQPHTSATGKQNTLNQNTVKQAAQKQPTHHDARPVSHSVFGPRSPAVATGYSDAVYGQVPSQPRTAPHTERQSQTLPQQTRPQAALNYSILPEHVLNRNRSTQRDQTPIMIRPENRRAGGPSWSVLPNTAAQQNRRSNISAYSQLPAHRQQRQPDQQTSEESKPTTENGRSSESDPNKPASEARQKIRRAFPLVTPPPIPNQSGEPTVNPSERRSSRPANLISSTNHPDDLLQIPSDSMSDSTTAEVFHAPLQIQHGDAISHAPAIRQLSPDVSSGWSNFANSPGSGSLTWWEGSLGGSLFPNRQPMNLTLAACLSIAQTNSPELQVLHSEWYIEQAEADRLAAAFDWNTFVEAIWNRDSAPVGSDLDGATNRLRSRSGNASFGVRRQTETGAELEVSQQFGTRSGNSIFLNPNPQATSRLQFDYEKPLLRGFGEDYNTSPQKLAVISKDTAYDRFRIGVQDYLLNVSSAYWSVVLQRGIYLQSQASLNRVQQIADEMTARIEVDVTPVMLDRALSEVSIRKANLIQARYDVLRVQSALLRLIYGAEFNQFSNHEIITSTKPLRRTVRVQAEDRVQAALQQRSEVHQAIREIKAATIRYDVAASDVLPALNLVLSGYVAGLDAGDDIGTSWGNQFTEGEPGVGIGFDFEVPYRNRAAEAAAERQQITIKRVQAALQTVIADVGEDVRNQVIERNKYGDMLANQREAIVRVRSLMKNAKIRREGLADGNRVADLYLENLLQIQNRLEAAESAYLQSQVRYSLADNALLRAIAEIDTLAGDSGQYPSQYPGHLIHSAPSIATPIVPVPMNAPASTGYSFGN